MTNQSTPLLQGESVSTLNEQQLINNNIQKVKDALGAGVKRFDIEHSETLVNEGGVFSSTVKVRPKSCNTDEGVVKGGPQYLQIDAVDDEYSLIIGEDTELSISYENIYYVLYWSEAMTLPRSTQLLNEAAQIIEINAQSLKESHTTSDEVWPEEDIKGKAAYDREIKVAADLRQQAKVVWIKENMLF